LIKTQSHNGGYSTKQTWIDTPPSPDREYTYRICAYNSNNQAGPYSYVSAKVLPLNFEPETPTIITVTGEIIEENNTDETIAGRGGYIYDEQTKQLRFDYRTYVKELIYIVDINETTITLNWFTIPNATYYEFYLLERDGKFKLLMTNDGCKDIAINRKTLENSTQVFIKAYKEDKELINSLPQEFWKINKETTENTATNEKQTITGKHQQQANHSITATLIKEMKIALIMERRISYNIKILYMPAILVLVSFYISLPNVKLNDLKEEEKKEKMK